MKTVLASEAMELCAKAMEQLYGPDDALRPADVRAIYQAAATIRAIQSPALGDPEIPIPDWLAAAGE